MDPPLSEMFIFQRLRDALEGGLLDRRLGKFSISNPSTAKAIYTLDGHRRGGDCNIQRCKALLQVDKLFLWLRFFWRLSLEQVV